MDSQKEAKAVEEDVNKLTIKNPPGPEDEKVIESNQPPGHYMHIDLKEGEKKDRSLIGSAINAYIRGKFATDPRLEESEEITGVYEFWKVGIDFSVSDLIDHIKRINRYAYVKIILISNNNHTMYTFRVIPSSGN